MTKDRADALYVVAEPLVNLNRMRINTFAIRKDGLQGGLANLEWIAPQVIHTQLKQIKGVQKNCLVVMPVANEVEVRQAVRSTGNRLATDHAGLAPDLRQCLHDQREPLGQSLPARL